MSSILHAAKKLVCCNVMAMSTGMGGRGGAPSLPPDVEVQHGIALITTALRAVDTCLQVYTLQTWIIILGNEKASCLID